MSPETRKGGKALDKTKGLLQTEWVAPTALRPHETAEVRDMLEKFTTKYYEGQMARDLASEQRLATELEEGLRAVPGVINQIRTETPIPHVPGIISPTHNRTGNEPSHTALLDPPVFYRNGPIVDRELWSSSSPSHSSSETSSASFAIMNPAVAPKPTEVGERIPTLFPGGWSPAVTEWALNTNVAELPATDSSAASSADAATSSNGDTETGLHAPFHRLPRFTFQPGNPE
ncbi:hypothetical protein K438DRAFT_2026627, partial [Mycena galopus ATCC 62051]